jgi:hypothetical protein
MLADAVEASTRAIEQPTVKKIEDRIDELIKARFMEGQLDECELTLRDLTRIKSSFVKILTGIHHSRMQYPETQTSPLLPEAAVKMPIAMKTKVKKFAAGKRRRIRSIDAS